MKLVVFYSFKLNSRIEELSEMVSSFRHEYFFLSNFYMEDIKYRGRIYKSAEHMFQIAKCTKKSDREKIRNAETPRSAKIIGRFVQMRPHWDVDQVDIMETIIRCKFRNPKLKQLLRETGDMELTEQNYWHDTFWGVCGCSKHERTGLNMLGKILMKIRDEIK